MFQQTKMRNLGQGMVMHAPQMGPSMSPAFVFAANDQVGPTSVPLQTGPVVQVTPPLPLPVETLPPAPTSVAQVIVPVGILAAAVIVLGLTA